MEKVKSGWNGAKVEAWTPQATLGTQNNVIPIMWFLFKNFFVVCRLFYAGAMEGQMPEILTMIQTEKHTPAPAVLFVVSAVPLWKKLMLV